MPSLTRTQPAITVRLARADEGPAIDALFHSAGYASYPYVTWEQDVSPFWLVAVNEDGVGLGCLQVRVGKPMGAIENLCVPLAHSKRMRVAIMHALIREAAHVCQSYGIQAVQFAINPKLGDWERIVQRFGAVKLHEHINYVAKV